MAYDKMQKEILERLAAIEAKLEQILREAEKEEKKPAVKKPAKS
jgi:hypothetical protein